MPDRRDARIWHALGVDPDSKTEAFDWLDPEEDEDEDETAPTTRSSVWNMNRGNL